MTLPAACVVATLLWWLPVGGYSTEYLLGWLACALTTYVLLETATTNALLRIRSRMISSLFLLLMAACGFLHPLQSTTITLLLVAISFYCLLRTYEQPRPEVDTLHAYLFLSLGSLLWPPLLLLAFVHWWSQSVYLRSLSLRSFGAALIGIVLPYAFWATGAFAMGDLTPFISHTAAIIEPVRAPIENAIQGGALLPSTYLQWLGYEAQEVPVGDNCWWATVEAARHVDWNAFMQNIFHWMQGCWPQLSALVFVLLLGLTGFIHYARQSFDDKIRVRMCHYTFMFFQAVVVIWLICQPYRFPSLFPLLLFTSTPAAAHFIALTRTWSTNFWTFILTLALIAVGVCCLALPQRLGWPLPSTDLALIRSFTFTFPFPFSL